jgi:hypothetical protein
VNKIRPSIIAQRTTSLLTGKPRKVVRNYSSIDPKTVARPVGIGSAYVHAAAIRAANANVLTTVSVIGGVVVDDDGVRPASRAWMRQVNEIRNGQF